MITYFRKLSKSIEPSDFLNGKIVEFCFDISIGVLIVGGVLERAFFTLFFNSYSKSIFLSLQTSLAQTVWAKVG